MKRARNQAAYKRARQYWNQQIQRGKQPICRRCNNPILPGEWHLGHPDDATRGGPKHNKDLAPEHTTCNTSAGASEGNRNRTQPSREW